MNIFADKICNPTNLILLVEQGEEAIGEPPLEMLNLTLLDAQEEVEKTIQFLINCWHLLELFDLFDVFLQLLVAEVGVLPL
ncbi:hypothetical protein QJS04_geneDACA002332 [Acorus gramineus]|uniref:Uncharacterized protein n=1 Tax=Acorus gramineus TaxID=55184 RepID=A0AAV9AAM9_ACOGR|nr:hypothetical protein QJS04_geneDACA002332 [Acorus gramineus]